MANESGSAPAKHEQAGTEGSVKETIESILVAFILAFIFRAFVVEAFVIPTGSMGPTLMGAHLRLECPDCGYRFTSNFSSQGGDDTDIPAYFNFARGTTYACPNCGYRIPFSGPKEVYFGDRILVLKYRYLFNEPAPWDVVVFKSPYEKKPDPDDPKYTDNFIKRLVGLPGQSVVILDGDVYIGPHGGKPGDFKILRKPLYAQTALWRDVFDNDYLPQGLHREDGAGAWKEPWTQEVGGTGWQGPQDPAATSGASAASRVFNFENALGESAIRFDSTVNHPNIDSLTDWLAYDQSGWGAAVGDLKLSLVYQRKAGQGPLRLQFTKRTDCFTAEILPGKVTLSRNSVENSETFKLGGSIWKGHLEAAAPELAVGNKPVAIEFINVDYRVSIRINGREVLATSDQDYTPDPAALYQQALGARQLDNARSVVRIVGANQTCSVEHVRLAKDVYYLSLGGHRYDSNNVGTDQPWFATPGNVMELGTDEYFVLGDNSQVSLDARFWGAPVDLPREGDYHVGPGRVPGRFLLGKAFFVYWPAGYRPPSLPYGIEPDFGDMRFIR